MHQVLSDRGNDTEVELYVWFDYMDQPALYWRADRVFDMSAELNELKLPSSICFNQFDVFLFSDTEEIHPLRQTFAGSYSVQIFSTAVKHNRNDASVLIR